MRLGWMRRWYWWSAVGCTYALGLGAAVQVGLARPPVVPGTVAAASAGAASVAAGRLLSRRFADVERRRVADDADGRARLVIVAVAATATMIVSAIPVLPDLSGPGAVRLTPLVAGTVVGGLAGIVAGRRRAVVLVGAMVVAGTDLAARLVLAGEADLGGVLADGVVSAVIAVGLLGSLHYWDLMARMERARQLEGELAVAGERLRFAADLHDVQGHHLQVIALKSELAARLAEPDPGAARVHIAEVVSRVRVALAETRAVVHDERHASLSAELANAVRVLDAAGVDARTDHGAGPADALPPAVGTLLGSVVREATTNVLRHSAAQQVRVMLACDEDRADLVVRSDGAAPRDAATAVAQPGQGSGLTALAERVTEADGTLDWDRDGDWFTVTAHVPLAVGAQPGAVG